MANFRQYVCTNRNLCVVYETLRWLFHKICFFWQTHTPVWYRFDKKHEKNEPVKETLPLDKNWYRIRRPLYRHEHVYYDFDKALSANKDVKGIAFVFFMGIGDYLYTTPVFDALKKKYPNVPFHAHVGAQFDRNNSPLVGKLLETNPNFDKVYYFDGSRHPLIWKNYNYENAFKNIPEGFLAVPVYYDYNVRVPHRVKSLFETFGLPTPEETPAPVMYFPAQPSAVVNEELERISRKAAGKKGLIFLQLDSRGSNYTYPHVKDLAQQLIGEGYVVLSVTRCGLQDENYVEIDIKKFSINETWHLLSLLKEKFKVYVIAVNSVFWAASAGLKLPNLGLQHWVDKKVHNLWYPNIQVVTDYVYPLLPEDKMIPAPPESYRKHNRKIIDYQPSFIVKWFKETFEK